jgi:hypothetical protein
VFLSVVVFAALDWSNTSLPNDNVAGVKVTCANADQPGTRRKSKRTVQPKNRFVPCFADLELELGK